jgi:hypothetical protein
MAGILQSSAAVIRDFADVRHAASESLGMMDQPLLPDVLNALTPDSRQRSRFAIDDVHSDIVSRRSLVESFIASSALPGSPLVADAMADVYITDRVDLVSMASVAIQRLKSDWIGIAWEIHSLKALQELLTDAVQDATLQFAITSEKVDTTYPEVRIHSSSSCRSNTFKHSPPSSGRMQSSPDISHHGVNQQSYPHSRHGPEKPSSSSRLSSSSCSRLLALPFG